MTKTGFFATLLAGALLALAPACSRNDTDRTTTSPGAAAPAAPQAPSPSASPSAAPSASDTTAPPPSSGDRQPVSGSDTASPSPSAMGTGTASGGLIENAAKADAGVHGGMKGDGGMMKH